MDTLIVTMQNPRNNPLQKNICTFIKNMQYQGFIGDVISPYNEPASKERSGLHLYAWLERIARMRGFSLILLLVIAYNALRLYRLYRSSFADFDRIIVLDGISALIVGHFCKSCTKAVLISPLSGSNPEAICYVPNTDLQGTGNRLLNSIVRRLLLNRPVNGETYCTFPSFDSPSAVTFS